MTIFIFQDHFNKQNKKSSDIFLKQILYKCFNIENIEIIRPKNGKPFLKEGPFFNITHSHDIIVLALSFQTPIGIDIEKINTHIQFKKIIKNFFSKEDQEIVGDSLEKFYELWTQKESFIKLIGKSIFSKEFKNHAKFNALYKPIYIEGFVGHVCHL